MEFETARAEFADLGAEHALADVDARSAAMHAEHPVQDGEFMHWKLMMEKRYPIDLGPLWTLVGAAR